MVMERAKDILSEFERKWGLPPLSQVAESLQKFPDMPKLRLIKINLEICERLSRTSPELEKIVTLVNLIADTPTDKLANLEKVLKQANRLVAHAPELEKVVTLVTLIADTPTDKLEKLEKILKQANKLVAHAPNELLEFLSSLKEG